MGFREFDLGKFRETCPSLPCDVRYLVSLLFCTDLDKIGINGTGKICST